jgi:organic radical activating enzyme
MELLKLKEQIDTRLPAGDMSGIKLRECNWSVKTAGPSPDDNNRTELFFLGCKKAFNGNPCKGCFNSSTWDESKALWTHDPILMAKHINNNSPNKYITIGGGEPTDQIRNLIILCKELKKYNFHIMIYTWRELKNLIIKEYEYKLDPYSFQFEIYELLKYIDMVVDGQFKEEERLWDGSKEDGLISSVGSGNQIIWDIRNNLGYSMRDLKGIKLAKNNDLIYLAKNKNIEKINLY